ncbi:urease accessory protein UreE [Pseudooceanicola aestuarii]|uniref:urease accessory protein UreE n=1 Tax=Pseudooceanicola aestuarii TaxID=2697319 RepID=UPI0013D87ECE|nr:urease accessory protein UreE [Pseudooceanicola aestuarii]
MTMPVPAHRFLRADDMTQAADDHVALDYDARFLRRKVLETRNGLRILVDLERTISLDHGDALILADGRLIAIRAAAEPLLRVTGPDPVRLAWHIGNRHTPCQITPDHLLIRRDKVIAEMLRLLGATLAEILAPFTPEGGAYGHGRTHAHDHGHSHDHGHDPDHGSAQDQRHSPAHHHSSDADLAPSRTGQPDTDPHDH